MFFKNNPSKEEILHVLSKSWPLSLTEIRSLGQFNTSYQYIRQCVQELIKAEIINKKGMKYELSKDWLRTVNKFSQNTLNNYQFGCKNNILNKETTQVQMNSLNEMGHFMLEALECRFLEPENKQGFFSLINHLWIPFASKEKQNRLLTLQDKISVIHTKNDFLDKFLHKTCYDKYIYKVKHVKKELDYDLFIYNNCVFQIYFPHELSALMDRLYSTQINPFKKISDLFAMTFKEFPINIVITRNKELANKQRKKIIQLLD